MDDLLLHHAVTRFMYLEARLLDERHFDRWLELWAPDATYALPTTWHDRADGLRVAGDLDVHHLRTDTTMLGLRITKLMSGLAWAEEPASRTVRSVTNIEVTPSEGGIEVRSNLVLHRVRYTDDVEIHACTRSDRLVPAGSSWQIGRRHVTLAHGVLCTANLEFFL